MALSRGDLEVHRQCTLDRSEAARRTDRLADVGAKKTIGRGKDGEKADLLPHVLLDVSSELPIHRRSGEFVRQNFRAAGRSRTTIAKGDSLERVGMMDHAI